MKRMQGISEKAGSTSKFYLGGFESDNYFELDKETDKLSLYLGGEKKIEWNA